MGKYNFFKLHIMWISEGIGIHWSKAGQLPSKSFSVAYCESHGWSKWCVVITRRVEPTQSTLYSLCHGFWPCSFLHHRSKPCLQCECFLAYCQFIIGTMTGTACMQREEKKGNKKQIRDSHFKNRACHSEG